MQTNGEEMENQSSELQLYPLVSIFIQLCFYDLNIFPIFVYLCQNRKI